MEGEITEQRFQMFPGISEIVWVQQNKVPMNKNKTKNTATNNFSAKFNLVQGLYKVLITISGHVLCCCRDSWFCYISPECWCFCFIGLHSDYSLSCLCWIAFFSLFSSFGLNYKLLWECPVYACLRNQPVNNIEYRHGISLYT